MPSHVTLLTPDTIDLMKWETNPAEYPLRYLAEGDSWFSYGSWKLKSLLTELNLQRDTAILTLAEPGDTVRRMSDISCNVALDNWLSLPWGACRWNALLISAGGNDVIGDALAIIPASGVAQPADRPADAYIDEDRLNLTLQQVKEGYQRIVALRDRARSPCAGVPLVTHDYDLPTPRNAPASVLGFKVGPWLYPAMVAARIPKERWSDVSDVILGRLARTLLELEVELPNFHVARTQRVLRRAEADTTGVSNEWDNEIHPTGAGFRKLARLIAEPLEALT